jgi:hypothetical protein
MDPYLHMWPASKGMRKGKWQCEAKGRPVLSSYDRRDIQEHTNGFPVFTYFFVDLDGIPPIKLEYALIFGAKPENSGARGCGEVTASEETRQAPEGHSPAHPLPVSDPATQKSSNSYQ